MLQLLSRWNDTKTISLQAQIFEEIDISDCTVAEYTLKNVGHAFQVNQQQRETGPKSQDIKVDGVAAWSKIFGYKSWWPWGLKAKAWSKVFDHKTRITCYPG